MVSYLAGPVLRLYKPAPHCRRARFLVAELGSSSAGGGSSVGAASGSVHSGTFGPGLPKDRDSRSTISRSTGISFPPPPVTTSGGWHEIEQVLEDPGGTAGQCVPPALACRNAVAGSQAHLAAAHPNARPAASGGCRPSCCHSRSPATGRGAGGVGRPSLASCADPTLPTSPSAVPALPQRSSRCGRTRCGESCWPNQPAVPALPCRR